MNSELGKRAIGSYFRVKEMYLLAEETSPEFKDFLQPVFEINRGFDHLSRVMSVEFGLNEDTVSESYVDDNLHKAIGHFYRAFFDIADWLSVNLRGLVIEEFRGFSHECISQVTPEYYTDIRPRLERANQEIARIRTKKDVGNSGTVSLMEQYAEIINDLRQKITDITPKKPALIDCQERCKKRFWKNWGVQIATAFFIAITSCVLGAWLSH